MSSGIKLLIRLIEKYENYRKNLILLPFCSKFPRSVIYTHLSQFLIRDFALSIITMIPAYGSASINAAWEPKLYIVKCQFGVWTSASACE